MTEEEAKTKWCPAARVDSTAANRPNPGPNCDTTAGWPPCIGSACMAWRWKRERMHDTSEHYMDSTTEGRCGLAGKP